MVIERYMRTYVYNSAETDHGFVVSNDGYNGDPKCPAFIPEKMPREKAQTILGSGEVEFGSIIPEAVKRYVLDGMLKLFAGEASDWNIISFEVMPAQLQLKLANPKLCAIRDAIDSLDFENPHDIVSVKCSEGYNDILDYIYLTLYPVVRGERRESIRVEFSNLREDVGEVDYFDISISSSSAEVQESHKNSCSRRKTYLTFSDKVDSCGDKIMIGEIEEVR